MTAIYGVTPRIIVR